MSESKKPRTAKTVSETDLHAVLNVLYARIIPESEWRGKIREAGTDKLEEALGLIKDWMCSYTKQSHVQRIFQVCDKSGRVLRCLNDCPQLMQIDPAATGEIGRLTGADIRERCRGLLADCEDLDRAQGLALLLLNDRVAKANVKADKLKAEDCLWITAGTGTAWSRRAEGLNEPTPKREIGPVLAVKTSRSQIPTLDYMLSTSRRLLALFPNPQAPETESDDVTTVSALKPLATTDTAPEKQSKKPKKASSKKKDKKKEKKSKKKKKSASSASSSSSSSSDGEERKSNKRKAVVAVESPPPTTTQPLDAFPAMREARTPKSTASPKPATGVVDAAPDGDDLEAIARYERCANWFTTYMHVRAVH